MTSIFELEGKLNAGSFNRYFVVYEKCYSHSIFTWKNSGKWFKRLLTESYQILQRPTVAVDLPINVEFYIDGVRIFQNGVLTQ